MNKSVPRIVCVLPGNRKKSHFEDMYRDW